MGEVGCALVELAVRLGLGGIVLRWRAARGLAGWSGRRPLVKASRWSLLWWRKKGPPRRKAAGVSSRCARGGGLRLVAAARHQHAAPFICSVVSSHCVRHRNARAVFHRRLQMRWRAPFTASRLLSTGHAARSSFPMP